MAALVVLLPRFLSMSDYGYWQLYLFYAAYLGYLSFGLADGIFLRFSGARLGDIPRSVISGHFRALVLISTVTLGTGAALAWRLVDDRAKAAAIALACLSTIFYLLRSLLTFTHQAANRMELYATCTVLERSASLLIAGGLLVVGYRDLVGFLLADVIGRALGLVVAMVSAREFLLAPRLPVRQDLGEIWESFRGGIFVSVSAIATVLVTAVGRLAAERGFGIEVFAQIALAFSLVNVVQTVVTPMSLAVLPNIRRLPRRDLSRVFGRGLDLVMPLLVLALVLYLPMVRVVQWWLPQYSLLPAFLGALLPVVVFESRTRLFAIPFLQGLRRERLLAAVNVASLLVAIVLAVFAVAVLESPLATVLSLTAAVVLRGLVLEWITARELGVGFRARTLAELTVSLLFVVAATGYWGAAWAAFAAAWAAYLWWSRDLLLSMWKRLPWSGPVGRHRASDTGRRPTPRAGGSWWSRTVDLGEASSVGQSRLTRASLWTSAVALGALAVVAVGTVASSDPLWGYAVAVGAVVALWIGNLLAAVGRWRSTFVYLGFHLGLALFLISNPVIATLRQVPFASAPERSGSPRALWLLALSLVALRLGAWAFERWFGARGTPTDGVRPPSTGRTARLVLLGATLTTLAISMWSGVSALLFVRSHSYAEYYTSYISPLPTLADVVGAASGAMVACYLAQFPRGRSHYVVLGGLFLTTVPQLAMGLRGPIIEAVVLAAAYALVRKRLFGSATLRVRVIVLVAALLAVPVSMAGLGALDHARFGQTSSSGLDPVTDFVYSQSITYSVVARGLELYPAIPTDGPRYYSVGEIVDYLEFGKPAQLLFGAQPLGGNTVRHAEVGHELSHSLSYYLYGQAYLDGRGAGSSYLLETFIDGGVALVAGFSLLVGAVLMLLGVGYTRNWFWNAVLLLVLPGVLLIPRASATGFLLPLVLPHFWLAAGLTWAVRWSAVRYRFGGRARGSGGPQSEAVNEQPPRESPRVEGARSGKAP